MKKIIILMSLISGTCFSQTTDQAITGIISRKLALESVIDQTPYKEDQHRAIEAYFRSLNDLTLDVKDSSSTSRRYSSFVSRVGVASFCSRFFVDQERWGTVVANCTRNRFFLCAEEVRAYADMRITLRNALTTAQKRTYDSTIACTGN